MTFGDDGRTLRGEEPAEVAAVLAELEVAGLGANCTVGPAVLQIGDMQELFRFAEEVLGPLIRYDATHKLDLAKPDDRLLAHIAVKILDAQRVEVHERG